MEQHPVPQNVTTFQFRLIGDMTLKQFGYLAGGAILAYIFYKLPIPFFFSWPLAAVAAILGVGFAFFPIEERPMDVWVLSFFKSVYSPTQYIWKKNVPQPKADQAVAGTQPAPTLQPKLTPTPTQTAVPSKKTDILQNLFSPAPPAGGSPTQASAPGVLTMQKKSSGFLDWFFEMLTPKPKAPPAPAAPTLASRMDFTPPPAVVQTQKAIEEAEKKETEIKKELAGPSLAETRVLELQKQLTELLSEHDKMEHELAQLRKQAYPTPPPSTTSKSVATPQQAGRPTVQIITADRAVKAGLPRLTTFPNVVTGIVKDSDQNLLPGVLVTVKDKEGIPLRALKTNRLGQFAASTPLPNGVYLVEIEDPRFRYTFDRAQITLNGTIVPALEIFAKSQKEITRAKLEKELFGKPN